MESNPRTRPEADDMTPENSLYRLPSIAQKMDITPEMASDWLSFRNHDLNRPLSVGVAEKYARMIREGEWKEGTPEGLIFDTTGRIISGQHRLKALANTSPEVLTAKYGHPYLVFWVFPDEPREIFDVVDQQYKRTAAHLLRVKYATHLASGARILRAMGSSDRFAASGYSKMANTEVVRTFQEWPELTWYGSELFAAYKGGDVPIGPHAAVMAQAARTEHREAIPEWLAKVAEAIGLEENEPARRLRKRFHDGITVRKGGNAMVQNYSLITKAWNAFARGEEIAVLRYAVTEPIPDVEGYPRSLLRKDNSNG